MKPVVVKMMVVLSLVMGTNAFAGNGSVGSPLTDKNQTGGFFTCRSSSGIILTADVDGEANVENARVLNAGSVKAARLEVDSLNLVNGLDVTLLQRMEEEGIVYNVKVPKNNGASDGTLSIKAGESSMVEGVTCIVKFKAAI